VQNNLAVKGSVTVLTAQPLPTLTTAIMGGTQLNLSWPATWTGGTHVQGQDQFDNNWSAQQVG
jgi:hypothetical protein